MNLQREDWILAGVQAMARGGVEAVRVEALARDLGVSKGSFYWHFRDRADLLDEIQSEWERDTLNLIRIAETEPDGAQSLKRLLREATTRISASHHRAVQAFHVWASKDQAVAVRVAAVEQATIDTIARLFERCGFHPPEARRRAQTLYLVYLGWIDLLSRSAEWSEENHPLGEELVDLLLAPIMAVSPKKGESSGKL